MIEALTLVYQIVEKLAPVLLLLLHYLNKSDIDAVAAQLPGRDGKKRKAWYHVIKTIFKRRKGKS